MRGRCVLCQDQGPDNEILSEPLKEIRWATSAEDFQQLIIRFRRLPGSGSEGPHSYDHPDRNLGHLSSIHSLSPFLRPETDSVAHSLPFTTGYEADAQLLAVIQAQSPALPERGARVKWWPNGMSCDEFRDIRRLLFSCRQRCCRVTPLGVAASKFVSTSKSCPRRHNLSKGKNQQENKHHYVPSQVRSTSASTTKNINNNSSRSTEDGASDNNNAQDGHHLNKGFHWRVNFLLKRCTGPQNNHPKAAVHHPSPAVVADRLTEQHLLVELRQSTTNNSQETTTGNNSDCVVNWTLRSDQMCGPERLYTTPSDMVSQFNKLQV